nr:unnamed protein product [Spirometra erinaceieuropaei]
MFDELTDCKADRLIGNDIVEAHWVLDQRLGGKREPFAVKPLLDWMLLGSSRSGQKQNAARHCIINQEKHVTHNIKKPYDSEFSDTSTTTASQSLEDKWALAVVRSSVAIIKRHYQLLLPWRNATAACVSNFTRLKAAGTVFLDSISVIHEHSSWTSAGLNPYHVNFNRYSKDWSRPHLIFILGLGLFIGAERVTRFFFQWHKIKGTSFFFGGMLVVIFGFPLIGMLIELYGSFLLFSGFLPVVFNFLYRVPVIGWLLTLPGINRVTSAISGQSKSMV